MSASSGTFDFGSMAASYDSWYKTPSGRTYDAIEKKAVAEILPPPTEGNLLLEIGCGTGHWSAFFSERGFLVTGVDISAEMIRVAREKGIANASFELADAHSLPFEDGRFHVAVAITALEFVRDPVAVLGEMVRCACRPQGIILVGVLNALARINRRRKAAGKAPYGAARLFSPRDLNEILSPYGDPEVTCTGFVPASPLFLPLAGLLNGIGRMLRLSHGAFIVGRVKL